MSKYLSPSHDEFVAMGNGHCDFAWDKVENACEFLFGGEMTREPMSLKEEYIDILKGLTDVCVPMSGGVDSETIAEACVDAGIEWRPVIMRYMVNGRCLNTHDIQYAELFCEENDKYPGYIDLDIEEFLGSEEFWQICKMYYCVSPQLACHLWMLTKLTKYTPVIPGDFLYTSQNRLSVNVFKYHCYDFYFDKRPVRGIAKLLSHTPEIIASQILLQKEITEAEGNYDKKCKLYQAGGFRIKPRPYKYTGFEEVLKHYQMKYDGNHLYQVFNDRYRKPLVEKIQQPEHIHVWVNDELQEYLDK
jgi:hypothetical protein